MSSFNSNNLPQNRNKRIRKLQRELRWIQNQMDLVEILCNFWPLPNMVAKRERLEGEFKQIQEEHLELTKEEKPQNIIPLQQGKAFEVPRELHLLSSQGQPIPRLNSGIVRRFNTLGQRSSGT